MKKNSNKGFTLIELLVVIAIIGILSSVVLASLTTARQKGNDAAIKTSLANMRAQAEILYGGQGMNTYGTAVGSTTGCTGTAAAGIFATTSTGTLKDMVAGVNSMTGNKTRCASSNSSWAFMASTSDVTKNWCVDSTGNTTELPIAEGFKGDATTITSK